MIRAWLPPSAAGGARRGHPAGGAGGSAPGRRIRQERSPRSATGRARPRCSRHVKRGSRYSIASVMTKPWGVADSFLVEDVPKGEAAAIERRDARLDAVGRGLARGLDAAGSARARPQSGVRRAAARSSSCARSRRSASIRSRPTPRRRPKSSTRPSPGSRSATTPRRSPKRTSPSSTATSPDNWFEAGDAVDAVLKATNSIDEGAQALLEGYLPSRRDFWASQCALSALALKDERSDARRNLEAARAGRARPPARRPPARHPVDAPDRRQERDRLFHAAD